MHSLLATAAVVAMVLLAAVQKASATSPAFVGRGRQHTQAYRCQDGYPEQVARKLLSHWLTSVEADHSDMVARGLGMGADGRSPVPAVEQILQEQQLLSDKDYCIFRMHWVPAIRQFTFERRVKTCTELGVRAEVLRTLLTFLAAARPGLLNNETAFSFYFDPTAASRTHPGLHRALALPLLSLSRSTSDRSTLPIPQYHMVLAMFWMDHKVLLPLLPPSLKGAAEGYHTIHSFAYPAIPWHLKLPKAVYRGGCFPTFSPSSTNPNDYTFLRAELCRANTGNALFDIGTNTGGELNPFGLCQASSVFKDMCDGCRPCNNKPRMTPYDMTRYRYQINTDGFGAASDATVWKLAIGSVVLWQVPENSTAPAWVPWYYPSLVPYTDFVPATAKEMGNIVRQCVRNDTTCQKIGAASRQAVVCRVNLYVAMEYLAALMQYLQCLAGRKLSVALCKAHVLLG